MRLNIEPSMNTDVGYNCMESSINDILRWKLISFEKALIKKWTFKFIHDDTIKTAGDRLYVETLSETAQRYKKYCGIDSKLYEKESGKDFFEIIENEISEERPLIAFYDTYNCPWFVHYHKQHSNHFCTVVGIDEKNVYCIDSEPVEKNGVIERSEFAQGCNSIITLKFNNVDSVYSDLKSVLRESISGLSDRTFDDLRCFADCFKNMNMEMETNGSNYIYEIPIYFKTLSIYGSRYQFGRFIEYLQKFYDADILKYLSNRFNKISFEWASVKTLICKAIYSNKEKILLDISQRIKKAADMEEEAAKKINDYLNNEFVYEPEENTDTAQSDNYFFVDLSKYFNNKGFEGEGAGFRRSGQYYLTEGLPKESIWIADNMKFRFPNIEDLVNDNISCKAQVIKCPNGVFSRLMILCSAEWGSFIENVVINYKDGTKETKELAVSDWSNEPDFQEKVMWSGKTANKKEVFSGRYNIYARVININNDKKIIESITLPDFEDIHIFALTLA